MRRLPPTAPGIPSIHSKPPMPALAAAPLTRFSPTPTPAVISKASAFTSTFAKSPPAGWITKPSIPPSRTSRFDPRPITKTGNSFVAQKPAVRRKPPPSWVRAQNWAGPPTRSVVCLESGSYSVAVPSVAEQRREVPRGFSSRREPGARLVDVSRAQADHQITRLQHRADARGDQPGKVVLVESGRDAPRAATHPRSDWPVTPGIACSLGGINARDHHDVGRFERASELVAQRLRARITVRLKHRDDPARMPRARRLQRGADFTRMMAVIIDHREARAAVFELETPPRAAKRFQRARRSSRSPPRVRSPARSRSWRC